jgi:hypothetical protein
MSDDGGALGAWRLKELAGPEAWQQIILESLPGLTLTLEGQQRVTCAAAHLDPEYHPEGHLEDYSLELKITRAQVTDG